MFFFLNLIPFFITNYYPIVVFWSLFMPMQMTTTISVRHGYWVDRYG
jgi:hypothetical protein